MESPDLVLNRVKKFYDIDNKTWSEKEELADGIFVYRNVINKKSIEYLEDVISDETNNYIFSEALVGFRMKMPDYRNCFDFKYRRADIESDKSLAGNLLKKIWQDLYDRKSPAVKDYCKHFNIGELKYWEAMNFIKYGPGQHFQEHHDHGYSYNCVVSLVSYPNDDYDGGELYFSRQNLKIKPQAGDLYIFPSNYMYPHTAMPVKSGTKYSIVTMLDYSERYHNIDFSEEE